MTVPPLVLASNSPRRKEILGWTGIVYSTHPADIDESPLPDETPEEYVLRLANRKSQVCASYAPFNGLVLAADTTVEDDNRIMGKPVDLEDARNMLIQLRGHIHHVHTAVVVLNPSKGIKQQILCSTDVHMRRYSDEEIEDYLKTGDPIDKAGAYAIQHPVFRPVIKFAGCFASVMGFPLCHFEWLLRRMGYGERKETPSICQEQLSYSCPIYQHVLRGENVG